MNALKEDVLRVLDNYHGYCEDERFSEYIEGDSKPREYFADKAQYARMILHDVLKMGESQEQYDTLIPMMDVWDSLMTRHTWDTDEQGELFGDMFVNELLRRLGWTQVSKDCWRGPNFF